MIQARLLKAWWLLVLLVLIPVANGEAAPNLVGIWKGTAPGAGPGYCLNDNITLTITKQCGNLFRGKGTIWTNYTFDFLGSIKDGTFIKIHGCQSSFMIMGEYQAGSPAKINVTYLYTGSSSNEKYDTFPASYSGKVKQGFAGAFDLLLLN